MTTRILIEALDLTEAQINKENRTVRQRIIVAGKSANGRHYPETVLQASAPLFEAVKTYANHPALSEKKDRPERSVRDLTGWLSEVAYENGALYGTRHFTETQAGKDTWALVEQIVDGKAPASLMGGSINAVGHGKLTKQADGDVFMVESINKVHSVDDVTTPAAGGGFERLLAGGGDELTAALMSELTFEEFFEARPDYIKRIQNEMKVARQDDALKAAKAEAESAQTALQEAQAQLKALESARDAALLEVEQARREAALEKALAKAGLPPAIEKDLRTRLMEAALGQWLAIIQSERAKLKAIGYKPRVAVTGAGQQVSRSFAEVKIDPIIELRRRIAAAKSPEELQRIQESIGR